MREAGVCASVLDTIGATPLVELRRLGLGPARACMKLENLNPGGSHKARIALNMILTAEREGILSRGRGQTIIEPTGGNTGVGLAQCAAVFGYRLVLVIPDNYSPDKQALLRAYGASIVLSDSSRGNNSHGELAWELYVEHPDWVLLNQQANPANPAVHREHTAGEIVAAVAERPVAALVGGVGTGGHLTGVGQVLKQRWPDCRVIAVQPEGTDLLAAQFERHRIQGLAIGLIPEVLDTDLIDSTVTVSYGDARDNMLWLMRCEGIAAGISTGANVAAVRHVAAQLDPRDTVVTFAYDNAADYPEILAEMAQVGDAVPTSTPRLAPEPA